ncbi:hypothetical protein HK105_204048 [Polyrhizophydium stewartii]|uniref:Uncharacterized protein n=1 Tax=Polyrhizophydium stewartii TaxID=2732419 RepID=A0ABR4N9W6_9FUNG
MESMVVLSESHILAKAKGSRVLSSSDLGTIRSINLWGQDLTDVSILARLPQLEVLSLAVNKINTLAVFSALTNLRELYLRQNHIADPRELFHLADLPSLRILWLVENPIADLPGYRRLVLRMLPGLSKLDDSEVADDERDEALLAGMPSLEEIEDLMRSISLASGTTPTRLEPGRIALRICNGAREPCAFVSLPSDNTAQVQTAADVVVSQADVDPGPEASKRPSWLQDQIERTYVKQSIRAAAMDPSPTFTGTTDDGDVLGPTFTMQPQQHGHHTQTLRRNSGQSNILYAVLTLLKELDMVSLHMIRDEIDKVLPRS